MKIFFSWSGNRSKQVAIALQEWLQLIIHAIDPWISTDIEKGKRWNEEISKNLEETKIGIIILDKSNLNSRWILFEAGAISKSKNASVNTFLVGVKPADIKPPLSQFQHTRFEREDIKKLVYSIHKEVIDSGEKTITKANIDRLFHSLYPDLEEKLKIIKELPIDSIVPERNREDILEEILVIVRGLSNDFYSNKELINHMFSNYLNPQSKLINNSMTREEKIKVFEESLRDIKKDEK